MAITRLRIQAKEDGQALDGLPIELTAPAGTEFTNEYRLAKDEWHLFDVERGIAFKGSTVVPVFILRKLESARERRARLFKQVAKDWAAGTDTWLAEIERIFAENPDEVVPIKKGCTCQHAGNLASQEILAQRNPHSYGCPMYKQDEVKG